MCVFRGVEFFEKTLTSGSQAARDPPPYLHLLLSYRRLTIVQSVRLLFLVLYPFVGFPHGVCEIRPLLLPLPPPCGWSTAFIATPLTAGRRPSHRDAPAFPNFLFLCCGLDNTPIVAMHSSRTSFCSPARYKGTGCLKTLQTKAQTRKYPESWGARVFAVTRGLPTQVGYPRHLAPGG